MEVAFIESRLITIDITGKQWIFLIGIRIGDPEQRVYDRLGQSGWRYFYDGQVQIDYAYSGRLSIDISKGNVSRNRLGVNKAIAEWAN